MSAYKRDFVETKYMCFLIKNYELLEKHIEIWEKVSSNIKKIFDSEPAYSKIYLTTKIESYKRKIGTNSHNDQILKECSECIGLSVIFINSVLGTCKTIILKCF